MSKPERISLSDLRRVRLVDCIACLNDAYGNPRGVLILRDHKGEVITTIDRDYGAISPGDLCTRIGRQTGKELARPGIEVMGNPSDVARLRRRYGNHFMPVYDRYRKAYSPGCEPILERI